MSRRILFTAVRNEGPFLLEWISYHKVIGFTDIFIVANDCDDGSLPLMQELARAGEITFIEQTVPSDVPPQLNAQKVARASGFFKDGDWVMWLDADEFLLPNVGTGSLLELTDELEARDASAITVAWRFFGDSGNETWPGRHISEKFTLSAHRWRGRNAQVKTLFRYNADVSWFDIHRPTLQDNTDHNHYKVITSSGANTSPAFYNNAARPTFCRMTGETGPYRLAMVAHFSIRTPDMFAKKAQRGDGYYPVGADPVLRDQKFYDDKNINDSEERGLLKHEQATVAEMNRLMRLPRIADACDAIDGFLFPEWDGQAQDPHALLAAEFQSLTGLVLPKGEIDAFQALKDQMTTARQLELPMEVFQQAVGYQDRVAVSATTGGLIASAIAHTGQASDVHVYSQSAKSKAAYAKLLKSNALETVTFDAVQGKAPAKKRKTKGVTKRTTTADLINDFAPNVLVFQVDVDEIDVLKTIDLQNIRSIILIVPLDTLPAMDLSDIYNWFDQNGLFAEQGRLDTQVKTFNRTPTAPAPRIYTRGATSPVHPTKERSFVIPTCMKNEAPYILEWIAFHKAIGVQDFVVFSNHCTDGTDLMLDRLDELGVLTHLPNPAALANSTYFQASAMKFAVNMPQVKRADYVIQTDVDEFINIHVGDGHLNDLLDAAGPFHVLSISEVNFCSSGKWDFEDAWVTEAFEEHETKTPGHWQARRGVKSIIHGLDNFSHWPVHRPGTFPGTHDKFTWLDGSGDPVTDDFIVNHENGIDRRGRYGLAQIDHHPLRSAQAFLLKKMRGDVAHHRNDVDVHYYRKRSLGGNHERSITNKLPAAKAIWKTLMQDPVLSKLHADAVAFHKEQAVLAEGSAQLSELRDWIAERYFPDHVRKQ